MSNRIHISDGDTYNISIGEPVILLKKPIHEIRGTWDYSNSSLPPCLAPIFLPGLGEKCLAIGELMNAKQIFPLNGQLHYRTPQPNNRVRAIGQEI